MGMDSWGGVGLLLGGDNPLFISSGAERVVRGGSWYNSEEFLRPEARGKDIKVYRGNTLGFRLVRTR